MTCSSCPKRIATKDSPCRNPERYFSLSVEVKDWQRAGTNHRWWRETLAMKLAYRGVRGTSSWSSWSLRSSSSSHPHKVRASLGIYTTLKGILDSRVATAISTDSRAISIASSDVFRMYNNWAHITSCFAKVLGSFDRHESDDNIEKYLRNNCIIYTWV